jgi:hypothetical protein
MALLQDDGRTSQPACRVWKPQNRELRELEELRSPELATQVQQHYTMRTRLDSSSSSTALCCNRSEEWRSCKWKSRQEICPCKWSSQLQRRRRLQTRQTREAFDSAPPSRVPWTWMDKGSREMKMKKLSNLDVNYHPCEKIFCPNMNFMDENLDVF